MTAPLSLSFEPAQPGAARMLAASLPASVRLTEIVGEITLVDGQGDWPERATQWIVKGARRILVLDPDVAGADAFGPLLALAGERGAKISFSECHGDNPAAAEVKGWLDERFAVQTIAGHGQESLVALVLQQLRIARATGLQALAIDHAVARPDAVIAVLSATRGEAAVALRLTATRSSAAAPNQSWMAHAPDASASLTVFTGPAARPATAMQMTAEGGHCPPTIYEHAHRASLRAMVAGSDDAPDRLRGWLDDAALATAIVAGN